MKKLLKSIFSIKTSNSKQPSLKPKPLTAKNPKHRKKFTKLDLSDDILKALEELGYREMTPIQEQTYPIISSGKDLCGLAETGSGKTAACIIPVVPKIDQNLNSLQALIVVPTRELCLQYVTEIMNISKNTGIKPFAVYGGADKEIQTAKIRHEVHILVATPGRLIDLIYDGVINMSDIKCLILDEADELLNEGFLEDIEFLMSCIINKHQTLMFSATMPEDIKKLADKYMNKPEFISLISDTPTPKSIEHRFVYLSNHRKHSKFAELLKNEDIEQAIIFSNSRLYVDKLFRNLKGKLEKLEYIHGGLNQDLRSSIFWKFKNKKIKYLITTDVTGRGVDFSHVTHIFNWDMPKTAEQYTHRTGRTGRMGKDGKAITFVTQKDIFTLKKILSIKDIKPVWLGHNPLLSNVTDRQQNMKNKKYKNYKNRKNKQQSGQNKHKPAGK
ncbi:MAG: DEAD/DEAH box helicase [Victivallales bacterium]|nr:DEAD/DEAH box helicase [Victivallales bacterium]